MTDLFFAMQPVPDFGLNLKIVHYFWNSRSGAVALEAVPEEKPLYRWRPVFDGTDRTFVFQ